MGMYPLEELISKWGRGELTVEQAIGQILLWLQWLERGERGDRNGEGRRERREGRMKNGK
jgi:hypothetical protein